MSKEGWTTVTLGDIAENISVRVNDPSKSGLDRFVGLVHLDSGSVAVSRWDSTESVTSLMKQFQAGDVLLARRNAHLRRASAVDFEGVCSGDAYVLREKPDAVVPGLLKYILNTNRFWEYAIANADGSMSTRVKWKHLEKMKILLPRLSNQLSIVNILDEVTDMRSHLYAASTGSRKLFSVFTSQVFEDLIGKYPTAPLGDCLSEKITSGHSPKATKDNTGHSLLTLAAVSKYGFVDGHEKPTQNIPEVKRFSLKKDDVLISRSNTRELVGLAGVVKESREDISFPDLMFRVRPDQSKLLPNYLLAYLLSKFGRRYMMSNAQGTSGSMKKINTKILSSMPIPIIPLKEQKRIACVLVELKDNYESTADEIHQSKILFDRIQRELEVVA